MECHGQTVASPETRFRGPHEDQEPNSVEGELSTMCHDYTPPWIIVDSGLAENVVSEPIVVHIPAVPSRGSTEGVRYPAANGTSMPKRVEQAVRIITDECHRCMVEMQVICVKRPLMSVSRICDAGHSATSTKVGGAPQV